MAEAARPSRVPYFYGRISRDDAEKILKEKGCHEGLFLLRESMSSAGNYALSICHNQRVHHYSIERQPDGCVMIQDGKKFKGPVELVTHHKKFQDGFLTKPVFPCNRPEGSAPMAWPGVTMLELEHCLLRKAETMGLVGNQLENVLGPQRHHFVAIVAKELHKEQPWFHSRVEREEADQAIQMSGHKDGKFLVRERVAEGESYALSLSFRNQTKHYRIDKHRIASNGEKFAIEDGPRFDCLMDMIAHYHNRADGLLCKLTEACSRRGFQRKTESMMMETPNQIYRKGPMGPVPDFMDGLMDEPEDLDGLGPQGASAAGRRALPLALVPAPDLSGADDPQKIYDSVPRTDDVFNLNRNDLELHEKLGAGNFGSVMQGSYRRGNQVIPVAVKTLKENELSNGKSELMREARLMADLQHRNIVRMIGVCKSDMIMLVLELASLGPLNKYLKKHSEMTMKNIIELSFQVAEGMAYLDSKNFVHRDLAARNVLLVNEHFAKISDFGMSKALGIDGDYYRANVAGKWPLKWYAPECIYYFKFDSKSDVWSYGVTLWEASSYGSKPYKGLRGHQILELIDQGGRLEKPDNCPQGVYEIMFSCWLYNKDDRPSFKEIVELLRKFR